MGVRQIEQSMGRVRQHRGRIRQNMVGYGRVCGRIRQIKAGLRPFKGHGLEKLRSWLLGVGRDDVGTCVSVLNGGVNCGMDVVSGDM